VTRQALDAVQRLLLLIGVQLPGDELLFLDISDHRDEPYAEVNCGQLHADEDHRPMLLRNVQRDLAGERRLPCPRGGRQEIQPGRQPECHPVQVMQPGRDTR
jgi:hypothetical protein